jgi:hypothetical protein
MGKRFFIPSKVAQDVLLHVVKGCVYLKHCLSLNPMVYGVVLSRTCACEAGEHRKLVGVHPSQFVVRRYLRQELSSAKRRKEKGEEQPDPVLEAIGHKDTGDMKAQLVRGTLSELCSFMELMDQEERDRLVPQKGVEIKDVGGAFMVRVSKEQGDKLMAKFGDKKPGDGLELTDSEKEDPQMRRAVSELRKRRMPKGLIR